jgi:hypothetical protein
MSTRAFIIVGFGLVGPQAGDYRGIYLHSDGHPYAAGRILQESYRSFERAHELMDLGALSVLAPEIGDQHGFDEARYDGSERAEQIRRWCLAYGRDRGEAGQQAGIYHSMEGAMRSGQRQDAEYIYVWREGLGRWQMRNTAGSARGAGLVNYSTERST